MIDTSTLNGQRHLGVLWSTQSIEYARHRKLPYRGAIHPNDIKVIKVSVPGDGGDSARPTVWRASVSGGGHRTGRLRWSCEASTLAWRGPDDRGEIGAVRAAGEGGGRRFSASGGRGGAAVADGSRRRGPDRCRTLRTQWRA